MALKRRTGLPAVSPRAATRARFPSGRSIAVQASPAGEALEIRSPAGEMELRIVFTPEGPVVSLRCARLELVSAGAVALDCRRFDLRTTEEIRLNGRNILLNCELPEGAA